MHIIEVVAHEEEKEHDGMTSSQQVERRSSSSNVPFRILSPQARVESMRKTIKTLQLI